jgi:hypothetical protein
MVGEGSQIAWKGSQRAHLPGSSNDKFMMPSTLEKVNHHDQNAIKNFLEGMAFEF